MQEVITGGNWGKVQGIALCYFLELHVDRELPKNKNISEKRVQCFFKNIGHRTGQICGSYIEADFSCVGGKLHRKWSNNGIEHLVQVAVCHWECLNTVRVDKNDISTVVVEGESD